MIKQAYLFVMTDPRTGEEGVLSMKRPEGHMPMIATDQKLLEKLLPIASRAARKMKRVVKVIRLCTREELGRLGIDGSIQVRYKE